MMALARTRRSNGLNYWPGFVDALSTLILSIIFLLTVFVVMQFYLQQDVASKNSALSHLSAQVAYLGQLLSMEKTDNSSLKDQIAQLRMNLTNAEGERDHAQSAADAAQAAANQAQATITADQNKFNDITGQLSGQKKISDDALAQVETLNQQIAALRSQLSVLAQSLDAAQKKNTDAEAKISDLGQKLNVALAEKVNELNRYRSNFFGKLREILGDRPDIRIVGDRFVFQSEVFFDSGRADLKPEGRSELDKLAAVLLDIQKNIPTDLAWVLRVDGHTDVRPTAGTAFRSNWDLSAARAISVVQYLVSKGLPPQRLVAAGFGEFQPIDASNTEDAYRRNRRIEFKLTER
jgi:chemotaxis protein MotB